MGRDLGLADRLRAQGLVVVEVDGWQTRGSATFNPRGSVNHHTAGPARGNSPSLGICINGRAGLAGPLCNVFQARDNTIYVVAAGRANHAGTGGWRGLTGNSSVYGLEVENVGTGAEPWRQDQIDTMVLVHRAFGVDPELVCQHKEWTSRKIDAAGIDGNDFRARIKGALPGGPAVPPPTPPVTESGERTLRRGMSGPDVKAWQTILSGFDASIKPDGIFGPLSERVTKAFQAKLGLNPDGIVGKDTRRKTAELLAYLAAAAAAPPPPPPYPGLLKRGSRGTAVRQVQQRLGIHVDGDYGPATDHAVRAFQRGRGLSVDGIVGRNTWNALWT